MPDTVHHETTQQLIRDIERKDRRFRFAQSIFMVLLMMGFVAGGWFAAQAYQSEQKARDEANQKVLDAIDGRLDDQSKQLQCVVQFFTIAPDQRAELKIKSVDDCFSTEQANNGTGPAAQEGEQRPNFTPGPSGPPLVIDPLNPGPGLQPGNRGARQDPGGPDPDPEEPPASPPVEILGIPVCVPLTDICIRQ